MGFQARGNHVMQKVKLKMKNGRGGGHGCHALPLRLRVFALRIPVFKVVSRAFKRFQALSRGVPPPPPVAAMMEDRGWNKWL